MIKIIRIASCSECPKNFVKFSSRRVCDATKKAIGDVSKIPDFCPLENDETKEPKELKEMKEIHADHIPDETAQNVATEKVNSPVVPLASAVPSENRVRVFDPAQQLKKTYRK